MTTRTFPARALARLACAALLIGSILSGCDGGTATTADAGPPDAGPPPPPPVPPSAGQLLIEELYYAGAPPAGGTDHYFSDQFIELVNAADVPLDLSGVLIGEVHGVAGEINPGLAPDSYRDSHPDQVVMSTVWRIPAGVTLAPGARLVIAHDGTNHVPFSTIDLSGADLEAYVAESGRDEDSPTVANLESVHFTGGYDWLLSVFGPSVVLLEAGTTLGDEPGPFGGLKTAPVAAVLDAIEALMPGGSADYKRLPDAVDTGFAFVSDVYTGESLRRRRDGEGWQDTNDSGADFERGAPDPGLPPEPVRGTGEPFVELGAGAGAHAPITDGDSLELVAGLQGGWHLDVTSRIEGFGPDGVRLAYEAFSGAGEPVSFVTYATLRGASVTPDGEGWARVGDRVVLDVADPSEVVGASVLVRVTATLEDRTVSDERTVMVVDEAP